MTERASRLRYAIIRERPGRVREGLRLRNLHAPSLAPIGGWLDRTMRWALLGLPCAVLVLA